MSSVTNLILSFSEDDPDEKLKLVNTFFELDNIRGMVSVESPELPRRWYGGNRTLEVDLAIGAFNHLHLPLFLEHLKGILWEEPDWVQLFVMGQDDATFRIVNIGEARKEPPWVDLDRLALQERARNRWGEAACVRCGVRKSIWADTAKGTCSRCGEPLGPEPETQVTQ
ncbi:MAG: hypothetical protein V4671_06625 [Armatimonadota bacterium]